MISGLIHPTSGEILYNDKKIKKINKEIFMMHQHYTNFPWKTCLANVLFPISFHKKINEDDIINGKRALSLVGLNGYENKYPNELSGGMNQRLSLARLFIANPKVILMDEPLSALDDKTRNDIQNILLAFQNETKNTMIIVTHSLTEAEKMSNEIINL